MSKKFFTEVNEICKPYELNADIYECGKDSPAYSVELMGAFPGWDVLQEVSEKIREFKEVDKIVWRVTTVEKA